LKQYFGVVFDQRSIRKTKSKTANTSEKKHPANGTSETAVHPASAYFFDL
jgi:hypothetical protein